MCASNLFDWNDPAVFKKINQVLIKKIPSDDIQKFISSKNRCYPRGELEWLRKMTPSLGDSVDEILACLVAIFTKHFKRIKLFHACRPESLSTYYEKGIVLPEFEKFAQQFKDLVKRNTQEPYDKLELDRICEEVKEQTSNFRETSRDWICCYRDEAYANENGKQFFKKGAEHLQNFIIKLSSEDLKTQIDNEITAKWIPTLFTIELPLDYLDNTTIETMVQDVVWKWAGVCLCKTENELYKLDGGLSIKRNIRPEFITDEKHPG